MGWSAGSFQEERFKQAPVEGKEVSLSLSPILATFQSLKTWPQMMTAGQPSCRVKEAII